MPIYLDDLHEKMHVTNLALQLKQINNIYLLKDLCTQLQSYAELKTQRCKHTLLME